MATENPLNEAQQRRLLGNSQYADRLLSDIEAILSAAESKTIFPKFVPDLSPAQVQLIRGYMARFRTQLARALDGLAIRPPAPSFGALHSVRVTLTFVRVAVQEMAPHYLRGYGEVAEQAVPQLEGLCAELEGMLERLSAALAESPESSLPARLARLQQTGGSVELLRLLDRIIADRGLVELRPRLSMILERLESNRFEIAVFGRVSSGKSSLLNHILRTDALPVGVNPITAVPTRLVHGPQALLTATFAGGSVERLPIERLPEFVSEIHNPANSKGVARLVVELPCDRLRTGIALVDTPGLGAFAAAGAAETLAYLPQCDLGVVLIAAGSPLNDEDLSTILRLYEAAIPVKVLLSKADLLSPADLASALDYTARQLQRVLGADIGLHAVSTAESHADLLEQWFSGEIEPLYEKHQQLAQESSRRKTARLRDAVAAALQAKLSGAGTSQALDEDQLRTLERDLRDAAGGLEQARVFCLRAANEIRSLAPHALHTAAEALVEVWVASAGNGTAAGSAVAQAIAKTATAAAQVHAHLLELARTLAAALERVAAALGSNDAPPERELMRALPEMPRFDFPVLETFARPWIRYPRTLARKRAHGQLRAEIEESLAGAFNMYGRLVENWARAALSALQLRFDAAADAYRAQMARLASAPAVAADERQAILDDLQHLDQAGNHAASREN
ncbi:MAG TPA: dynamin family protein [Bryobacteraceae bacterium]|jgi:GTP-binding protein EngB required for normal cell division|nr:dynamin family protein [Bryobacteraceae bacterium]